ncbi:hypothetical protein Back11_39400 [Paenibacillus baekrokdamisoli]|uniref:Uncharacterized protein n=1 Tax=Paenibacillus baekrokdamisoli TaxID=1712516 RepID=A0A3G9J2L1_9BACL|nr:hypothetical protein [Paenibacillus baekrokdamisoli]MBB3068362.1 hypothetical protein [Paenibacillus baekrokdamisoli]BBH22595.1 hypothetical protein Back11_39400 [Paenibacillus baekrokdamisoli]
MKKLLPFIVPPIRTFNYIGCELGITSTIEESIPWYHMNYIQLCCPKKNLNLEDHKLVFSSLVNPFLSRTYLTKSFVEDITEDPIQFIIVSLNHGYYVSTYINEYFLPNRWAYYSESFFHDILVIGYDDDEKILNVVAYNREGQFVTEKVSYDNFRDGFIFCSTKDNASQSTLGLIIPRKEDFHFNILFILNQMEDFLNGKNDAQFKYFNIPINEQDAYGKDVYEYILSYIKANTTFWDKRVFRLLLEHKAALLERIKFLTKMGYLNNIDDLIINSEKLVKTATIVFNSTLKFNITNAFGTYEKDKLSVLIKQIEQQEEDILKNLILKIKQIV